jgi:hypothetical protein
MKSGAALAAVKTVQANRETSFGIWRKQFGVLSAHTTRAALSGPHLASSLRAEYVRNIILYQTSWSLTVPLFLRRHARGLSWPSPPALAPRQMDVTGPAMTEGTSDDRRSSVGTVGVTYRLVSKSQLWTRQDSCGETITLRVPILAPTSERARPCAAYTGARNITVKER